MTTKSSGDGANLRQKFFDLRDRFRRIATHPQSNAGRQMMYAEARGGRLVQEAVDAGYIELTTPGLAECLSSLLRPDVDSEKHARGWAQFWVVFVIAVSKSHPDKITDPLAMHFKPAEGCDAIGTTKPDDWQIRCEQYADMAEWIAERLPTQPVTIQTRGQAPVSEESRPEREPTVSPVCSPSTGIKRVKLDITDEGKTVHIFEFTDGTEREATEEENAALEREFWKQQAEKFIERQAFLERIATDPNVFPVITLRYAQYARWRDGKDPSYAPTAADLKMYAAESARRIYGPAANAVEPNEMIDAREMGGSADVESSLRALRDDFRQLSTHAPSLVLEVQQIDEQRPVAWVGEGGDTVADQRYWQDVLMRLCDRAGIMLGLFKAEHFHPHLLPEKELKKVLSQTEPGIVHWRQFDPISKEEAEGIFAESNSFYRWVYFLLWKYRDYFEDVPEKSKPGIVTIAARYPGRLCALAVERILSVNSSQRYAAAIKGTLRRRLQPDTKTDTCKKPLPYPESPMVQRFCAQLKRNIKQVGFKEIDEARDFLKKNPNAAKNPESLTRQARRYKHLWHPDYMPKKTDT